MTKLQLRRQLPLAILLVCSAVLFILVRMAVRPEPIDPGPATDYAEYETATVTQILTDSTEECSTATNMTPKPGEETVWRGSQMLIVTITSGRYEGQELLVENNVGPLTSPPLSVGDSTVVALSTSADGTVRAAVYEYDRSTALIVLLVLFLVVAVLVGGKTGAKSLVGLGLTLLCLFYILIPALMQGAPTLLTTFLVCAYIAVVCLAILGGLQKKTLCAMAATVAGTAVALLFGLLAQALLRLDGLRGEDVEQLMNLNRDGVPIGLKGLLIAGIIISSLGAVMDVTMGICSSMQEIFQANPKLTAKELFKSGMNVGKDMVGTMTTTLVLAMLGSAFTLILYVYSMNLQPTQLLSSAFFSTEVMCSIATSIGVVLSIPLAALICSLLYTKKRK